MNANQNVSNFPDIDLPQVETFDDAISFYTNRRSELASEIKRQKSQNASYNIAMGVMAKGMGLNKQDLGSIMSQKFKAKEVELQAIEFAISSLQIAISVFNGENILMNKAEFKQMQSESEESGDPIVDGGNND